MHQQFISFMSPQSINMQTHTTSIVSGWQLCLFSRRHSKCTSAICHSLTVEGDRANFTGWKRVAAIPEEHSIRLAREFIACSLFTIHRQVLSCWWRSTSTQLAVASVHGLTGVVLLFIITLQLSPLINYLRYVPLTCLINLIQGHIYNLLCII